MLRLIRVEHTIWHISKKVTNGKQHFDHVMAILSMLWHFLASQMHLMFFNTYWTFQFFVNTWMISWSITLMTSSFFPRTWRTMNDMYILFWTSLRKLDFMPSWRNSNFIKLKWNLWVTSSLEMAFSWISTRFKPLWKLSYPNFNFFKFQLLSNFHCTLFHYNDPSYSST
jgi:hypothetical protein